MQSFSDEATGEAQGYCDFRDAAVDIEELLDAVWVSAPRKAVRPDDVPQLLMQRIASMQVYYLLTIAAMAIDFLPTLSPSPRAMFAVLNKLDIIFAALIDGRDPDSGEELQAAGSRKASIATTEQIRIKSIAERTRIVVIKLMTGEYEGPAGQEPQWDEDDEDMETADLESDGLEMEAAAVYERTISRLGDELAGPLIGIGSSNN